MVISVVAGASRIPVSTVNPRVGMVTNLGKIVKVTNSTVVFEDGTRRRNLSDVTISVSNAKRAGVLVNASASV